MVAMDQRSARRKKEAPAAGVTRGANHTATGEESGYRGGAEWDHAARSGLRISGGRSALSAPLLWTSKAIWCAMGMFRRLLAHCQINPCVTPMALAAAVCEP